MNVLYPELASIIKRVIAWCVDKAVLLILILVINIFVVKQVDISPLENSVRFSIKTAILDEDYPEDSRYRIYKIVSNNFTISIRLLIWISTWILLDYLYYIFAIALSNQATIGQYLMNMRVVRLDGIKIEAKLAFRRNLSYCFPCFPVLIGISMFFIYAMVLGADSLKLLIFSHVYMLIMKYTLWITGLIIIPCWYLKAIFSDKKQTMSDKLCNMIVIANTEA